MMETPEPSEPSRIFVVKTQVGQEENVANMLYKMVKKEGENVLSMLAPRELRGYIFVEGYDVDVIKKLIRHMRYARDVLDKDVAFDEIEHFLFPPSAVANVEEGNIIELVSGPFKGEKAKVTRIDDAKEEITVELLEAMVPIPITVRGEQVRVLKKQEE
ncbi:MAG: transcription elongation factor Spt5 [Thermoplasmatota archaeon]